MTKVTTAALQQQVNDLAQNQARILELLEKRFAGNADGNTHQTATSGQLAQPPSAIPVTTAAVAASPVPTPVATAVVPRQAKVETFADLQYPMDNSKRKVQLKRRDNRTGQDVEEEKTVYLRDDTRRVVMPILQQQMPLVQFQVVIGGKPTNHYINLKCGKSASGNIQYSADKVSLPLSITDNDGRPGMVEVVSPAGIYLQAQQFMAVQQG